MSKQPRQKCLCDRIFGISADHCDATTAGLCRESSNRKKFAAYFIGDESVDFDSAVRFVATGIQNANAPAVLGVELLGTRAQQICADIARKCRGYIAYEDAASNSLCRQGFVTATLGEVLGRSDVAVCVGVDLSACHPRVAKLLQQNTVETRQLPVAAGQEICDLFSLARIKIEKSKASQLLSKRSKDLKKSSTALAHADELVRLVESKKHLTIVLDSQVNQIENVALDQIVAFAKSVHQFTKCYVIDLSQRCNETSAGNVLAWSTGFANHISFFSGSPEHMPTHDKADFDFVVRFCSENESSTSLDQVLISSGHLESKGGADQLTIQGLNNFPDSYARFDDVICEIQTTGPSEKSSTAIEFLRAVFQQLD